MSPKEKAEDLIKKFSDENYFSEENILAVSKNNAEITVDEIIKSWKDDGNIRLDANIILYWEKVKIEIRG